MKLGSAYACLRGEDAGVGHGERLVLVQLIKQVAARAELHHKNKVAGRDEPGVLVGDEGVRYLGEDLCLLHDVLDLAHRDDVNLDHLLESIHATTHFEFATTHLAEGALAKSPLRYEHVGERKRLLCLVELMILRHAIRSGGRNSAVAVFDAAGHLYAAVGVFAHGEQRVERPQQPLEGTTVHAHYLRRGGRGDGSIRRRTGSQREFSEVIPGLAPRQLAVRSSLGHRNLAFDDDVKVRPLVTFVDNPLVRRHADFLERINHSVALVFVEWREERHLLEETFVHARLSNMDMDMDGGGAQR